MPKRYTIVSLFDKEFFSGFLEAGMLKRAQDGEIIEVEIVNIRDFSEEKHQRVDDRPFGGGPGMVLKAEPVLKALRSVKKEGSTVVYMSPHGKIWDEESCDSFSSCDHIIFLCGHYEGIDARVFKEVDHEVSIGPYVLTNGALPALVCIDSLSRYVPGVLGNKDSAVKDRIANGAKKVYTRPREFEGEVVPKVFISGDPLRIEEWQKQERRNYGKVTDYS